MKKKINIECSARNIQKLSKAFNLANPNCHDPGTGGRNGDCGVGGSWCDGDCNG